MLKKEKLNTFTLVQETSRFVKILTLIPAYVSYLYPTRGRVRCCNCLRLENKFTISDLFSKMSTISTFTKYLVSCNLIKQLCTREMEHGFPGLVCGGTK